MYIWIFCYSTFFIFLFLSLLYYYYYYYLFNAQILKCFATLPIYVLCLYPSFSQLFRFAFFTVSLTWFSIIVYLPSIFPFFCLYICFLCFFLVSNALIFLRSLFSSSPYLFLFCISHIFSAFLFKVSLKVFYLFVNVHFFFYVSLFSVSS